MDAAWTGDVGLHVIQAWVLRFNADRPQGMGATSKLNDEQRKALAQIVEEFPFI